MKKVFNRNLQQLFLGVVLTTLCAPATIFAFSKILHSRLSLDFLCLIIILPLIIYYFDYIDDEGRVTEGRKKWSKYFVVLLAFVAIAIVILYGNTKTLLWLILLMLLGVLYPVIFKGLTKKIIGFKDFFVVVCWSAMLLLYFFYYGIELSLSAILLLVFLFIIDSANVIYCDIKDIESDRKKGLRTFASVLSERGTLALVQSLYLISLVFITVAVFLHDLPKVSLSAIFPVVLSMGIIFLKRKERKYPTWAVDSIYIIWALILLFVILAS